MPNISGRCAQRQTVNVHSRTEIFIINNVKEFYKDNKRSPFHYEVKYSMQAIRNFWDSFNDLLLECKLEINRKSHNLKTKEDGIKFLQELNKKLNRVPSTTDIGKYTNLHKNWFTDKFGSFKNALYESGLVHKNLTISNKKRIKLSINGLINLFNKLGKCPNVEEYDEYAKENVLFSRRVLETQTNLKYNDICMKYLGVANDYSKSPEQLLYELEQLKNELGRTPFSKEIKLENGVSSLQQYMNTFNMSYNQLVKSLGWELSGHEFSIKTDIEMLNDFYFLYLKLGRSPYVQEIDNDKSIASYNCYKDRFGSIKNICKRLNLEYNTYSFSGTICYDKLGRLCKSKAEQKISNYFIDNVILHHKEYYYVDILNKENNNRRRCDWILFYNSKIFIVEYFGLWDGRKNPRYIKKAKKKIKDLYKAGIIDQCIFIFPKDLKNKTLDDIFGFLKQDREKLA